MGQPQETPINQVLKLVEQLSPEEKAQLLDQLKMERLSAKIQMGVEQADRGEVVDGDEVFRQLRERNASMREKGNQ